MEFQTKPLDNGIFSVVYLILMFDVSMRWTADRRSIEFYALWADVKYTIFYHKITHRI